ncbi:glycosyltransferase [uncultured Shewanella sp.]|uniref:glycosyltransferase n=1 Tax=uncultured Shewanella sp. TaxID=173975 RepID=UPI00261002DF|nr:glycosyltransferase [uncultured Shewanella sp.]
MKVLYLTWGETPRSYGIYKSQVIEQFVETSRQIENSKFYFIAGLPIVHSGLLREKYKYYSNEVKNIRAIFLENNIDFSIVPIFCTQNFINSTKVTFRFMHTISSMILKSKVKLINPDVIHCRSYHACFAALTLKSKFGYHYKIVFDGRGLWPEEVALKKGWDINNNNYLYLKEIEKMLLKNSDVSISVSDTMFSHYERLGAKKVENIYLSTNFDLISKEKEQVLTGKIKKNTITLLYLGALSNSTWHTSSSLLKLYRHLKSQLGNLKLLIVTTSNHESIRSYFGELSNSEIEITSTKTTLELSDVLSRADLGCLPYRDNKNAFENLIGNTLLGTKTVEFLAARLPVLCNRNCGGAAKIIEKGRLGIVYDPDSMLELSQNSIIDILDNGISTDDLIMLKRDFDYIDNAKKIESIYLKLCSNY